MGKNINTNQVISGQKTIWIVGSSIIHWAEVESSKLAGGRSLGFNNKVKIFWMGKEGLTVKGFDDLIDLARTTTPYPDLFIVQCGSHIMVFVFPFN